MTMKIFHWAPLIALLAACSGGDQGHGTPAPEAPVQVAPMPSTPLPQAPNPAEDSNHVVLRSLAGSGLKFTGVYDSHADGDLHYYMRFFERGNVALVAGRQKPGDAVDLRSYLTEDAKSGQNNLHNVPVEWRGDSIFFSTMALRGAITYAGTVHGDTLRFLKHSKVTGKKAVVDYVFIPDGTPAP